MSLHSDQTKHKSEIELIICCAQTEIKAQQSQKISQILRENLDWSFIVKVADQNATFPLLAQNLLTKFESDLSPEIKKILSVRFQNHLQRSFFLTSKLIETAKLFSSQNIAVMPFKGPVLANRIYKNIALRRFRDLDILIHFKDLKKAVNLLLEQGYEPHDEIDWLNNPSWNADRKRTEFNKKDIRFFDEKTQTMFEIHWRLSYSYFSIPFKEAQIWEKAETVTLGGVKIKSLEFNDLFIYLCSHGSRHNWDTLGWVSDINELIKSEPEIDWNELKEQAHLLGCDKVLELGLFLVHEFFGTIASIPGWQQVLNNKTYHEIAAQIRSYIFLEERVEWNLNDLHAYQLKLKEKFWDKFKMNFYYNVYYLTLKLKNNADKDFYHFPTWLLPVYYVIRPVRAFYKSFKKSTNHFRFL